MIHYIFSDEIYRAAYGRPKGKGIWLFGDRNKEFVITVGSEEQPLNYRTARKVACEALEKMKYPMYKTIYLHG